MAAIFLNLMELFLSGHGCNSSDIQIGEVINEGSFFFASEEKFDFLVKEHITCYYSLELLHRVFNLYVVFVIIEVEIAITCLKVL